MHEPGPGHVRERISHRRLNADPVEIAHGEHERIELGEQVALRRVERAADAEQGNATRIQSGQRIGLAFERRPAEAESGRERHAVDVPGRRGCGSIQVAVRIEP